MANTRGKTSTGKDSYVLVLSCKCRCTWEGVIPVVADYITCRRCGKSAVVTEQNRTFKDDDGSTKTEVSKLRGWYVICLDCHDHRRQLNPGTQLQALMLARKHNEHKGYAEHHVLVIEPGGDVHYDSASLHAA